MNPAKAVLLVMLAAASSTIGSCAMAERCFTTFDPVLPARDKVRARLSNGEGGKRLYDAIADGDEAAAMALLDADPRLITTAVMLDDGEESYNGNDGDLLSFAVASCSPRMVALLLEMGAAPNGQRPGVALGYALLADTPDMAEMLLGAGASADPVSATQPAPFTEALMRGNVGAVRMLVRHGLGVDRVDEFGNSYLLDATSIRAFAVAEALIEGGANPWRIGMGGQMPAFHIVATGNEAGEQRAARERLAAGLRRPGLPWPPPAPDEVRRRLVAGDWPTPDLQAAGLVVDRAVIDRLREEEARTNPPV